MTTSFCVVGSPIEHSLSPILHKAAYKQLGADFSYGKNEVLAGGLTDFLSSTELSGASVTMPLKQEAFALASSHDQNSLATGASNTLVRSANSWRGFNTDVYGISQALAGVSEPMNTVVIGSGATARSGLVALVNLFPRTEVQLVSRNQDAGIELEAFAKKLGLNAAITSPTPDALLSADLVMSLVPAGSFIELWEQIRQSDEPKLGTLFDVAYNPWPSKPALAWNLPNVISGIEMLIWQAIEQVQLFSSAAGMTGEIDRSALYSVMKEAVSLK
jgi:shikimate dehydrogenase